MIYEKEFEFFYIDILSFFISIVLFIILLIKAKTLAQLIKNIYIYKDSK